MLRILFLGMPGRYAPPHLAALLAAPVDLVAVGVPAPPGAPPMTQLPPTRTPANLIDPAPLPGLTQLAGAAGLPVLALRRMGHPAVRNALRAMDLDLVCVACWPWRIPAALLAVPHRGWLNSHPSLLPALRGPAPLAEALQRGISATGVTIHWMDAGLDTGDIALQEALNLPEGWSLEEAEGLAANVGGRLLAEAVERLQRGDLPRRAQR
jgi:methionyl-tRNA formyltransferase